MEALKKCPFCGGTAKFRTTSIGTSGGIMIYFKVGCGQCGTSSPKEHAISVVLSESGELEVRNDEREAAIFEWNKRAETNTDPTNDPTDPNNDPNSDPTGDP